MRKKMKLNKLSPACFVSFREHFKSNDSDINSLLFAKIIHVCGTAVETQTHLHS